MPLYAINCLLLPFSTSALPPCVQPTKSGTIFKFRALVVSGNGKGAGGYGIGHGSTSPKALERAIRKANRSWIHIDRLEQRTLYHRLTENHSRGIQLELFPAKEGRGLRMSATVAAVLEVMGIQDCTGRVLGRRNPYNIVPVRSALCGGARGDDGRSAAVLSQAVFPLDHTLLITRGTLRCVYSVSIARESKAHHRQRL